MPLEPVPTHDKAQTILDTRGLCGKKAESTMNPAAMKLATLRKTDERAPLRRHHLVVVLAAIAALIGDVRFVLSGLAVGLVVAAAIHAKRRAAGARNVRTPSLGLQNAERLAPPFVDRERVARKGASMMSERSNPRFSDRFVKHGWHDEKAHARAAYHDLSDLLEDARRSSLDVLKMTARHAAADRGSESRVKLWSRPFDLNEELERVRRSASSAARAKSIAVVLRVDPKVRLSVQGDALRVRQVLMELVSNAIRHESAGSVVMSVSLRSSTRTHQVLLFSVGSAEPVVPLNDTHQPPGVRPDSGNTRSFVGIGSVLLSSRRVIDAMNGTMGFCAAADATPTFWFTAELLKSSDDLRRGNETTQALVLCQRSPVRVAALSVLRTLGIRCRTLKTAQEVLCAVQQVVAVPGEIDRCVVVVDGKGTADDVMRIVRSVQAAESRVPTGVMLLGDTDDVPHELRSFPFVVVAGEGSELLRQAGSAIDAWGVQDGTLIRPAHVVSTRAGDTPADCTGGTRILVVGDAVARMIAESLACELPVVRVESVDSQVEASRRLANGGFSAVLLGAHATLAGVQAIARALRQLERRRGERIPILTMLDDRAVHLPETYLAAGIDECISLPVNAQTFARILEKWITVACSRNAPVPEMADAPDPLNVGNLRSHYRCGGDSLWRAAEQWRSDALGFIATIDRALTRADRDTAMASLRALKAIAGVVDAHLLRSSLQYIEYAIAAESDSLTDDLSRLKISCEITASRLLGQASRAAHQRDNGVSDLDRCSTACDRRSPATQR